MDIYAQNILDRYKKPFYKSLELGVGSLKRDKDPQPQADSYQLAKRKEANHSCGDVVEVGLEFQDEKLKQYQFSGNGCAISMAASDMLGDLTEDMTADEILAITKEEIYEILGIEISIRRSKCALLGLLALQNAILESRDEKLRGWKDYHI